MANLLGVQIIGSLFGMFLIYYTFLQYKKKQLNANEYAFWIIIWVIFIIIAVYPQILDPLVKALNILRTLDLLIIGGFIFLIAVNFYTYTVVKRDNKKIEEIVRKIAIEKK